MEIRTYIGDPSPFALLTVLEGIAAVNADWMRRNPDAPGVYESGVRYIREGLPELWFDYPSMLSRRPEPGEDCDGLSVARAGELRVQGFDAHPVLRYYRKPDGGGVYHALTEVRLNDQWVYDDPSARLGMLGDRPRVAGDAFLAPTVPRQFYKPISGAGARYRLRVAGLEGRRRIRIGAAADDVPEAAPELPEVMRLIRMYRKGHTWSSSPTAGVEELRSIVLVGDPPPRPLIRVEGELANTYYYYLQGASNAPVQP